jgi:pyruvate formate lyase activating enzyme
MKEALLYSKLEDDLVGCHLCHHRCQIAAGGRGICGVRENQGGVLYTLVYDRVISCNVDPIEKKPFYHFLSGTLSLSIATVGCNFRCHNCQNYQISQMPRDEKGLIDGQKLTPEDIVNAASRYQCTNISYTYTEPTIFFELALDTARLAHQQGLKNVFVTNGYMTAEALQLINPYLDAANVDLKGFSDERYQKVCGARLQPVLDTIRLMKELGIWVEVTTLLIPGHNDTDSELEEIARFILSVSPDIPWHISAFYPTYRMTDCPRTSIESIHRAGEIGRKIGLKYIYSGNIPGDENEDTYCHSCHKRLIDRLGFQIQENVMQEGTCPSCHMAIPGVWSL